MKPVDMVVAAKLISTAAFGITYQVLSEALGVSASEAHQAASRLVEAGLFRKAQERRVPSPNRQALLEFWTHGLRYVYPAVLGPPTRGLATSVGAPPLREHFTSLDLVPVWPSAEGQTRGLTLEPVHHSAVRASSDQRVYELLSLLDALREGRVRERQLAGQLLKDRLYGWC